MPPHSQPHIAIGELGLGTQTSLELLKLHLEAGEVERFPYYNMYMFCRDSETHKKSKLGHLQAVGARSVPMEICGPPSPPLRAAWKSPC